MAEKPEHDHPQVTRDQISLWLTDPVTKCLLTAAQWSYNDWVKNAGDGTLINSSNADHNHAVIHTALGRQAAYTEMMNPVDMLYRARLIFEPEGEEK